MRDAGRIEGGTGAGPDGAALSAALLRWYDAHARDLPWRLGPATTKAGRRPDPYLVWLSEIMLQQTGTATVAGYFQRFTARWPDVTALASAEDAEVMAAWAGLGYYARARNLLAAARAVAAMPGARFPEGRAGLMALPGVGAYTAAAIGAIAYGRAETVVDGNVERVVARLFAEAAPLPRVKPRLAALAARLTPALRPGDHAQAMMDLGATICTPRRPRCGACPLAGHCVAREAGIAASLPRRLPRAVKPIRLGFAYVARRGDGALLLETRPPRGLLGGMPGFPVSDWSAAPAPAPPLAAEWREAGVEVRHTFTHFHLRLRVLLADAVADVALLRGEFLAPDRFRTAALPSLMRKVHDVAASGFGRS